MIKNGRIIFGNGTVSIGSSYCNNILTFQEMESPIKIGEGVEVTTRFIGEMIKIKMTLTDYQDLNNLLNHIEKQPCFSFKGYLFDFSNYNEKSVEVVKRHARNAISRLVQMFAC